MAITLAIAVVTIVLFLLSVLFFSSVGKKIKIQIYPLIVLGGGLAAVLFGSLTFGDVIECFVEDSSVNPIKILVLFLSMTVYSLILDKTGFFVYISNAVLKRAGHNQYILFLSLYAVISVLTVFTSNDIVILTFTPFICHFCQRGKISVIPYLIMEFVAANTWSMMLLIGNPTNIYISGAFNITFFDYVVKMVLPTVAAGAVSLAIMIILFRNHLRENISTETQDCYITDMPLMIVALVHLIACIAMLSISQYISIEMWKVSLGMAVSAVVFSCFVLIVRSKRISPVTSALRSMPFEIIPFVTGMFILVLALDDVGITYAISNVLENSNETFTFGFASMISSNFLNNIPMSVLFSKILTSSSSDGAIFATIAGSNIGAFLTPVGALAGIMWSNIIKQNGVRMSVGKFVIYGVTIGVPTMSAALTVIMLTL